MIVGSCTQAGMELLSEDSVLECQICFNLYSPRRRPKLLDCGHTCCSACLTQMRTAQRELRCPWCRATTRLPAGLPVSCLPDDPTVVAAISFPRAPERAAIFVRVPGDGCCTLPLAAAEGRVPLSSAQQKGIAMVMMPEREGDSGEVERPGAGDKGSAWSGVCTVLLVACVLLFLLGIVLHNMSCISKRLTVISCG